MGVQRFAARPQHIMRMQCGSLSWQLTADDGIIKTSRCCTRLAHTDVDKSMHQGPLTAQQLTVSFSIAALWEAYLCYDPALQHGHWQQAILS
jgi:hypothetical protein